LRSSFFFSILLQRHWGNFSIFFLSVDIACGGPFFFFPFFFFLVLYFIAFNIDADASKSTLEPENIESASISQLIGRTMLIHPCM
jgi:hypothetical protein